MSYPDTPSPQRSPTAAVPKNIPFSSSAFHNRFLVFQDSLPEGIPDVSDDDCSSLQRDWELLFSRIRAVVHITLFRYSGDRPTSQRVNVSPRQNYRVCSTDDLQLWQILNRQKGSIYLYVYTPVHFGLADASSNFSSNFNRSVIPFTPSRPNPISEITICSEDHQQTNVHAISEAFVTCLALASYSRGYWGTKAHRKGAKSGIWTPEWRTVIDVELASSVEGLQVCIPFVSPAQRRRANQAQPARGDSGEEQPVRRPGLGFPLEHEVAIIRTQHRKGRLQCSDGNGSIASPLEDDLLEGL